MTERLEIRRRVARLDRQLGPADLVHLIDDELERNRYPEVRARATHRPEQLGVLGGTGSHGSAVGEHHLDRAGVLDGRAVFGRENPDPARSGEPADPPPAVVAGAERPAVWLQRPCDVAPAS